MGFIRDWLAKNKIYEVVRVPSKPESKSPTLSRRTANPDELMLGFAEVKDRDGNIDWRLKGVSQAHRSTHFYVVGASGSGKTRFLETLACQDIHNENGFGIIDAQSDLTEDIKGHLYLSKKDEPDFLREQVVLIDPSDPDDTVCFNPLERIDGMDTDAVAGELMEVFKKIWADSWGNRMAALLTNTLIALIETELTLAELSPFITNLKFRNMILEKVQNQSCRDYFFEEFNLQTTKTQREWAESTLNKIGALLNNGKVRQMFVSPKSTFSFREIMDGKKILLVKLDRGRLKGSADLLGSLLLAKIQMAAFSRTDTAESKRVPFYLYIDEFQNFATESFTQVLAEARKYKLSLVLAHQNLAQLPPSLRASILTNCGVQAYFRISRADADMLAKESLAAVYQNPPGWEWYIQQLQELQPTFCVVKNKVQGGVAKLQTLDLPLAYEAAEMDEIDFRAEVAAANIGGSYLRKRTDIENEYQKRRDELFKRVDVESFREVKRTEEVNYEEIIKGGENDQVEFKVSIRWDFKRKAVNKFLEFIIAKSISAFMNVNGGRLFVGVSDSGEISGIENDYAVVHHKNKDGFLLQLTQIINQYLGKEFHQYTSIKIIPIKGKEVCVVEVAHSKIPVFLKNEGKEEFYIRASASSQPMSMKEANEYIRSHFHRS
ncbi:MAG: putative DNA binding domain-containing protein [bacterium]|nr:putative DNA binding domain-containing protein [bacterium]